MSPHTTLERKVGQNKTPETKMSADHECMKNKDGKSAYGNPSDYSPFPHFESDLNSPRKWTAIARVSIYIFDIITLHKLYAIIMFSWELLFFPNFGSRVA